MGQVNTAVREFLPLVWLWVGILTNPANVMGYKYNKCNLLGQAVAHTVAMTVWRWSEWVTGAGIFTLVFHVLIPDRARVIDGLK